MKVAISTSKLSSQNQIVIPKALRQMWKLKSGDVVKWVIDQSKAIVQPRPASWTEYMSGLHKEIWRDVDTDKWLKKERKAWDR